MGFLFLLLKKIFGPNKFDLVKVKAIYKAQKLFKESLKVLNDDIVIPNIVKHANNAIDLAAMLNKTFPNEKEVIKMYTKSLEIKKNLDKAKLAYFLITQAGKEYSQKDADFFHYTEAIRMYKKAIDIMLDPDVTLYWGPNVTPFRKYLAYLVENNQLEEAKKFQYLLDKTNFLDFEIKRKTFEKKKRAMQKM
jgi:tetratricopeptide (TPR) repeat protein